MKLNEMIIGVDFGETVESKNERGEKVENDGAMEVIARLVKECRAVYVISKVNPAQMVEVAMWMRDHDFLTKTGIKMENIRFCPSRRDKGHVALELGITHMIDDRPEVMAFISDNVKKILFNPIHADVMQWNQKRTPQAHTWKQVEEMLLND